MANPSHTRNKRSVYMCNTSAETTFETCVTRTCLHFLLHGDGKRHEPSMSVTSMALTTTSCKLVSRKLHPHVSDMRTQHSKNHHLVSSRILRYHMKMLGHAWSEALRAARLSTTAAIADANFMATCSSCSFPFGHLTISKVKTS